MSIPRITDGELGLSKNYDQNWSVLGSLQTRYAQWIIEARRVLKEIEWWDCDDNHGVRRCPMCGGWEDRKHKPDCALAALLDTKEE